MKKNKLLVLSIIMLLCLGLALAGCSNDEAANEEPQPTEEASVATAFTGDYVVDAEYLKAAIGNENVVIIDARGEEAAAAGTVQGAIALIWQQMADVTSGKSGDAMWGTLLPADQLSEVLSANGLAMDKEILIFADAQLGWGSDGRVLWGLIAAGYTNAKMVNGGYEYLAAAGVPTQEGATAPTPAEVTVTAIDETHLINTDALNEAYDTFKVVDVRADEEYNGETLYGELKGGHLPGAIHVRYADLFNEDSTLKSNDDIKAIFEAAGLTPEDQIVTYCTAGIRSAYMQLVLEMCGYENVKNYDESYYRWCAVNEVE